DLETAFFDTTEIWVVTFAIKVIPIKEAEEIDAIRIDELIYSLQTFTMNFEKTKKSKGKSKKNITLQFSSSLTTK
ncbi:hypothetical protein Goklo_011530, partial [Gossypium klotzschianum]|nr:hypothetical protein [Gossypium klotzschianum]